MDGLVEVYRGAGDRRGADVKVPLLEGEAALLERGWAEMNDRATPRESVTTTCAPKAGMLPGNIAKGFPSGQAPWVGRIVSVSFTADNVRCSASIGLERPL